MTADSSLLFGGAVGWQSDDWVSSDDRVRGGSSQSYLSCSNSKAEFHGTLDIKTLGGAGFASQRTTGNDRWWNLSAYDGIELCIAKADNKHYTFILKNEILPADPDSGREQSTISYECEFTAPMISPEDDGLIFIPWKDFKATYRGNEKDDAPDLNVSKIKRMSLMMRSYFGTQEGGFSLTIRSIAAAAAAPYHTITTTRVTIGQSVEDDTLSSEADQEKADAEHKTHSGDPKINILSWLIGKCFKL